MKIISLLFCSLLILGAAAQTTVTKSYPVQAGQRVSLSFDYPKTVKVSTWDKNEVYVKALVSINNGENDSAFELEQKNENGVLSICNHIKDMNKLPRTYTVMMDGQKVSFKTREAYDDYVSKINPKRYGTFNGVDIQITLEIKVPANTATEIDAKYGIVELVNFNAPVNVDAPYGGIDATVNAASTGKLTATTHYGKILTNLDLKLTDMKERDFFTSITAEPGKGPAYNLKSTYGTLYLRKP